MQNPALFCFPLSPFLSGPPEALRSYKHPQHHLLAIGFLLFCKNKRSRSKRSYTACFGSCKNGIQLGLRQRRCRLIVPVILCYKGVCLPERDGANYHHSEFCPVCLQRSNTRCFQVEFWSEPVKRQSKVARLFAIALVPASPLVRTLLALCHRRASFLALVTSGAGSCVQTFSYFTVSFFHASSRETITSSIC